jgi:DNA end-binding protein Ku
MASRSMWKGSISFGLVNIPAKVYLATENREFSFNQLCPNGHRIQYKKWCPMDEKEIGYADVKKGYQVSKDRKCTLMRYWGRKHTGQNKGC